MTIARQIGEWLETSSWIRRMFETGIKLKGEHGAENVFDFSLGNPVMEPPPAFRQTLERLVRGGASGRHRYMPNAGFPDVRARIADHVARTQGVDLSRRHIVMTVGAACAIATTLRAVIDPGDEVIVLAPYFVEYLYYVPCVQGVCRFVDTDARFQLDLDAIEAALSDKTKAIIVNSPNNPSGAVYPESALQGLNDRLLRHQRKSGRAIYVLFDDPYGKIRYEGAAPPVLQIFENGIFMTSHSKDLSLAGERIGYLAMSPRCDDIDQLIAAYPFCLRALGFVNAPALMQRTVVELQEASIDVGAYRARRDRLYQGLRDAGYECELPGGAFYLFPKSPIPDDVAFVQTLAEGRILGVPGGAFGRPGHFRLSYCVEMDTIDRALPGFAAAHPG